MEKTAEYRIVIVGTAFLLAMTILGGIIINRYSREAWISSGRDVNACLVAASEIARSDYKRAYEEWERQVSIPYGGSGPESPSYMWTPPPQPERYFNADHCNATAAFLGNFRDRVLDDLNEIPIDSKQ